LSYFLFFVDGKAEVVVVDVGAAVVEDDEVLGPGCRRNPLRELSRLCLGGGII
jgi:hypothetical protein